MLACLLLSLASGLMRLFYALKKLLGNFLAFKIPFGVSPDGIFKV